MKVTRIYSLPIIVLKTEYKHGEEFHVESFEEFPREECASFSVFYRGRIDYTRLTGTAFRADGKLSMTAGCTSFEVPYPINKGKAHAKCVEACVTYCFMDREKLQLKPEAIRLKKGSSLSVGQGALFFVVTGAAKIGDLAVAEAEMVEVESTVVIVEATDDLFAVSIRGWIPREEQPCAYC